jgi:hypothetical protein
VDNIKMNVIEIGWGGMDWIDLAQDRDQWKVLVNTVMNLRAPLNIGKFLRSWATGGFWRRAHLHGGRCINSVTAHTSCRHLVALKWQRSCAWVSLWRWQRHGHEYGNVQCFHTA